jgi:D-alanine-D-alanine ligase
VSGASRIAVLKGGRSMEREVSLRSGANVEAALRRMGYEATPLDVDQRLVRTLRDERPDVAFVALHGKGGEDGTVQELLEILGVPYTGPGVLACERSWDKVVAKAHFQSAGIPTPAGYAFSENAFRELGAADALPEIYEKLGFPLVIKPARQGSALGIGVAQEPGDLPRLLMSALAYDDRVLIERFVPGRELAVSVLGSEAPWALPVVEPVLVDRDFYDFEARYTPGLTELHAPADLPDAVAEEAAQISLRCYEVLGCRGFGRIDLILDEEGGLTVLEVNAIPGMTDTSLLPKAAEAAGMGFDEVVRRVVEDAAVGN